MVGEEEFDRTGVPAPVLYNQNIAKRPHITAGPFLNMVGEEGFEPPTLWSQTRCATKLRYSPRCFTETLFRQRMRILRILTDDARAKRSFFVINYPFAHSAISST